MTSEARTVRVQGGKEHELFASLLDRAHKAGVKSIDTELLWWPNRYGPDEGGYEGWIVKATVEMEDGRTFTAHGDASPENVRNPKQIRPCAMAETRAKARALRTALNVGAEGFEGEVPERPVEAVRGQPRASGGSVATDLEAAVEDGSSDHRDRTELLEHISELSTSIQKLKNPDDDGAMEEIQEWLTTLVGKETDELESIASRLRIRLENTMRQMKGAAKSS